MSPKRRARFIPIVALALGCVGEPDQPATDRRISLVPTAQFGSVEGGLTLQNILGMRLSPSGDTLFLVQWTRPFVLAISVAGDSLFTVGRGGTGPGEFSATPSPMLVRGDTLWVGDFHSRRLHAFVRGDLVESVHHAVPPLGEFQTLPRLAGLTADGDPVYTAGFGTGAARQGLIDSVPAVVVDRVSGAVRDTIVRWSVGGSAYFLQFEDGRLITGRHTLSRTDRLALDPLGRSVVVGRSIEDSVGAPAFRLTWRAMSGEALGTLEAPVPRVSSESAREDFITQVAHDRPREQAARAVAEQVDWPDYLPAILGLFVDQSGRTWVESPHESPDSTRWWLVGADRELEGYVVLPERVELMAAMDDSVWGWTPGRFDEPIVLRFRLAGSPTTR